MRRCHNTGGQSRPTSIHEALERGLVKDIFVPGVDKVGMGSSDIDGAIALLDIRHREGHGNQPAMLVEGHTLVYFSEGLQGYLNGAQVPLESGDYVRINNRPSFSINLFLKLT